MGKEARKGVEEPAQAGGGIVREVPEASPAMLAQDSAAALADAWPPRPRTCAPAVRLPRRLLVAPPRRGPPGLGKPPAELPLLRLTRPSEELSWALRRKAKEEEIDALLRRARHATARSVLDLAGQAPEGGRSLSLREVFAGFRQAGIAPHPWGAASDEAVAYNLLATFQPGLLAPFLCGSPRGGAVGVDGTPCASQVGILAESEVANDPRMSVNEAKLFPPSTDGGGTYGDVFEAMEDMARVKAGLTRALQSFDLTWSALMPTGTIPRPRQIVDALCEDDFLAFGHFTVLAIAWWLGGAKVAVVPRLFASAFNNTQYNNVVGLEVNDEGWDDWYWWFTTPGVAFPPSEDFLFQRYAVTVLWERWPDAYQQECARRKALAVAAFGTAVGAYLDLLQRVFTDFLRMNIQTFIPILECGNEMEYQEWGKKGTARIGEEYGRFHALLAGPIRLVNGWARFRVAELLGTTKLVPDNPLAPSFSDRVAWLERVLNVGVEGEVQRWTDYYREFTRPGTDASRWHQTCVEAGFSWPPSSWPPLLPSSRELAHEVGLHWYHENEIGIGYETDHALWSCIQELGELLSGELASWRLTWSASEVGFMAESDPDGTVLVNAQAPASSSTSRPPPGKWGFQAGELVRRMLLLRAAGAERVGWHTRMAGKVGASTGSSIWWDQFSAHGLRNDLRYHPASDGGFVRGLDAWRRPSWYSYRRLVWLFSQAKSTEVLACDEKTGLIVVRLVARSRFSLPEDGGYTIPSRGAQVINGELVLSPSYHYAYVAWVDQGGGTATDIWLIDRNDRGFQQTSLVPQVPGADSRPGAVDDLGYPTGDDPDWSWPGWAGKQCTITEVSASATLLRVHLEPLNNAALRCSPACVLTDAEYWPQATFGPAPRLGDSGSQPAGSAALADGALDDVWADHRAQDRARLPGMSGERGG